MTRANTKRIHRSMEPTKANRKYCHKFSHSPQHVRDGWPPGNVVNAPTSTKHARKSVAFKTQQLSDINYILNIEYISEKMGACGKIAMILAVFSVVAAGPVWDHKSAHESAGMFKHLLFLNDFKYYWQFFIL